MLVQIDSGFVDKSNKYTRLNADAPGSQPVVYLAVATPIRLQFFLEGKREVLSDANEMAAGINSAFATIGAPSSALLKSIKTLIEDVGSAGNAAFGSIALRGVVGFGEITNSVRALRAEIGFLAGELSGMKFPTFRAGGVGASAGVQSAAVSAVNSPASVQAAVSKINDVINTLRLQEVKGDDRFVKTTSAGTRTDQRYVDEAGKQFMLRSLEGTEESLRAVRGVSDEFIQAQAIRRASGFEPGTAQDISAYRRSTSAAPVANDLNYSGSGIRKDDAERRAEQLMASMGLDEVTFDKQDSQIEKAQEKVEAAGIRAAQREFEQIEKALDSLGTQEARAGQKSRAADAAIQEKVDQAAAAAVTRNQNNASNLASVQGFRLGSSSFDGSGQLTGQNFSRAAGLFSDAQTASLNPQTGEMTKTIQEASSQWGQLVRRITGDGGTTSKIVSTIFSPLRGVAGVVKDIDSAWNSLGNNLIRISALFYSFERIGRLIEGAFETPYKAIINATEAALKFEQAISGTVGGMGNASAIDNQLVSMSRNSSLTLEQIRESARMMTDVTSLAPRFALGGPDGAAASAGQLMDISQRMAVNNPAASQDAIVKAVDNALLGNLRGLRLVARVDPNDLTEISGLSMKALQGNSQAMLDALQRVMRSRVTDSALRDRQSLPSIQWEKLTEQFQIAFQRIGTDSNIMPAVAEKFHQMMDEMATYIDSPQFAVRAKAIGDSMGSILKNVLDAGGQLLAGATGVDNGAKSADGMTAQIQRLSQGLAELSKSFPAYARSIGESLRQILEDVKGFSDTISIQAKAGRNFKDDTGINPWGIISNTPASSIGEGLGWLVGKLNSAASEYNTNKELPGVLADQQTAYGKYVYGAPQRERQMSIDAMQSKYDALGIDDDEHRVTDGGNIALFNQKLDSLKLSPDAEKAGEKLDKLAKTLDDAEAKVRNVFQKQVWYAGDASKGIPADAPTDAFGALWNDKERRVGQLRSASQSLTEPMNYAQKTGDFELYGKLFMQIQEIQGDILATTAGQMQAAQALSGQLKEASGSLVTAGLANLKGLDPIAAGAMAGKLMSGNTPAQQYFASMGIPVGISAVNDKEKSADMKEALDKQLAGVKAYGLATNQPDNPSLLGGAGTNSQLLQLYMQASGPASDQLKNAQAAYAKNPTNDTQLAMIQAGASVVDLQGKIKQLELTTNEAERNLISFGDSVQNSLEKSVGTALDDMITKTGNLKDVWKNLGKEIVGSFTQNTSKTLIDSVFGPANGKGNSGFGAIIPGLLGGFDQGSQGGAGGSAVKPAGGGGGAYGGILGALSGLAMKGLNSLFIPTASQSALGAIAGGLAGAADGGIFSSWTPFAGGGIVNRPTLGLVGERRDGVPEGVIPLLGRGNTIPLGMGPSGPHAILPGGRRIAASFGMADGGIMSSGFDTLAFSEGGVASGLSGMGSSSQAVTIYNVANMDEAIARGYDKNKNHIINEFLSSARPGGPLRRILKKS